MAFFGIQCLGVQFLSVLLARGLLCLDVFSDDPIRVTKDDQGPYSHCEGADPFHFLAVGLCSYIILTWLLYYPINDISNNILRVFLQICTSVAFNFIRVGLSHLPLRVTIGSVNDNLSSIWRLSYRAQCLFSQCGCFQVRLMELWPLSSLSSLVSLQ